MTAHPTSPVLDHERAPDGVADAFAVTPDEDDRDRDAPVEEAVDQPESVVEERPAKSEYAPDSLRRLGHRNPAASADRRGGDHSAGDSGSAGSETGSPTATCLPQDASGTRVLTISRK